LLVHGEEPLVEGRVERDGVGVRRQLRGVRRPQLVDLLVGVGTRLVGEDPQYPGQRLAAPFERHQGVVEGRRLGVRGDLGDSLELGCHPLVDGRGEVVIGEVGEARELVGQVTRQQQGMHAETLRAR
jgi:hypothetical protein